MDDVSTEIVGIDCVDVGERPVLAVEILLGDGAETGCVVDDAEVGGSGSGGCGVRDVEIVRGVRGEGEEFSSVAGEGEGGRFKGALEVVQIAGYSSIFTTKLISVEGISFDFVVVGGVSLYCSNRKISFDIVSISCRVTCKLDPYKRYGDAGLHDYSSSTIIRIVICEFATDQVDDTAIRNQQATTRLFVNE